MMFLDPAAACQPESVTPSSLFFLLLCWRPAGHPARMPERRCCPTRIPQTLPATAPPRLPGMRLLTPSATLTLQSKSSVRCRHRFASLSTFSAGSFYWSAFWDSLYPESRASSRSSWERPYCRSPAKPLIARCAPCYVVGRAWIAGWSGSAPACIASSRDGETRGRVGRRRLSAAVG